MSGIPPVTFSATGPVPAAPLTLLTALLNLVAGQVPGYTANLPASLIDDMSGTAVGALVTIDQARVDAVNSVSPYGANPYVLAQLGFMLGKPIGQPTNGNVDVEFLGPPGFVIPAGFVVGDGTNQYIVQESGTISVSGGTPLLHAVATNSSVFPIPANSVTSIITSIPNGFTVTVTNPNPGTPASGAETPESYRSRILTAFQGTQRGTASYVKSLLMALPGVSARLVAVRQVSTNWEVIVGGGDLYQIAGAIYAGVSSPGLLVGAQTLGTTQTVSVTDAQDVYAIKFVTPAIQNTTIAVHWNTNLTNFTAQAAVNQFIITTTQSYTNSLVVGAPFNLNVLYNLIMEAIAPVLAEQYVETLYVGSSLTNQYITIGGVNTNPSAGTLIIPGDPESYFFTSATGVTSVQG